MTTEGGIFLSEGRITPFVDYMQTVGGRRSEHRGRHDTSEGGIVFSEGGITPFVYYIKPLEGGVVTSEGGITPQRAALFFLKAANTFYGLHTNHWRAA